MKKVNTILQQALHAACCQQTHKFHKLCYEILHDKVYMIAYGYSETDAKDLTQDIFLKIFELDINKLKPHASYIEAYLLRTARNYCNTYINNKKKKIIEDISEHQIHDKSYQLSFSSKMDLENALKSIPERQAIAVKMKSKGFKIKEIAETLNSSEGAVKTLIYNGRIKIKQYFKE